MRFRLVIAAISVLSGLVLAQPAAATAARVVAAPDATTLMLADGRAVLLDGLLAPDPADDGAAALSDRAAADAHAALLQAAVGRTVTLTPLLADPDRWGRLPADVAREDDGAWLQGLLLAAGHARLEACPRGDADRLARLRAAEASARAARRGLWALKPYWVRRADRPMRPAGFAVVEGLVLATGGGRKRRYLNFAEDWRKDFSLSADRRTLRRLAAAGLDFDRLTGRNIRARGWLVYRNGPMLTITCPQQIETLQP